MHGRQRGQALPLGLALALVGTLGALVLHDTGQLAADKARLANAADAAAYGGVQWQARALNFQAYTNRAMVANQVSMAQAVSLHSWVNYGAVTAENAARVLAPVPYVGAIAQGAQSVMRAAETFVEPLADAAVGVLDTINGALSEAQQLLFASSFAATPEIVRAVARASDPRFEADTRYTLAGIAANLGDWNAFTERRDERDIDPMRERAALVNAGRDRFTSRRDWEFFDFWFYSSPLTRHKVVREGETRLIAHEEDGRLRWELKAKDTVALHNGYYRFLKGWKDRDTPIGWAESYANSGGGGSVLDGRCRRWRAERRHDECRRWLDDNRRTERVAARARERLGSPYHGLHAFRSLAPATLAVEDGDPVLALRVEVALPLGAARGGATRPRGETFATAVAAPGDLLSSISVAEVYYRRPAASGAPDAERLEAANGYNPFWDTRLAPVAESERLVALALRGGTGGGSPPGGAVAAASDADAGSATAAAAEAVVAAGTDFANGAAALGEDVRTLAAGFGGTALAAARGALGERSRLAAVRVEDITDLVLDVDVEGVLRRGLEDVLERAVREILAGAVRGAMPEGIEALAGEVDGAMAEARAFSEELERLRDDVARDFEPALLEELRRAQRRHGRLVGRAAELRERQQAADSSRRNEYIAPIKDVRDDLASLGDDLRDRLADQLVTLVERHSGGSLPMPRRMARDVATQVLAGLPAIGDLAALPPLDSIEAVYALIDGDEASVGDALPWGSGDAEEGRNDEDPETGGG